MRYALLSVLLTTPGLVVAQNGGLVSESGSGSDRGFVVQLNGPPPEATAYSDAINVTVRVRATEATSFAEIAIAPMGDLNHIYPSDEGGRKRVCLIDGSGDLPKGGTLVANCEIVVSERWKQWLLGPAIWLRPGTQRLLVYLDVVRKGEPVTYLDELEVEFRAPLFGVFLGGITGAFLLALFSTVRERAAAPIEPVDPMSLQTISAVSRRFASWLLNLFPRLWRLAMQTVVGGICALLLILLAQATDGLNPPISIRIQDFWGGIVVGLFSIPISKWIWDRLQNVDMQPPTQTRDEPPGP